MEQVRLALIGCGAIAEWHVNAIRAAAVRTRITACVDPNRGRADEMAAQTGGAALASLDETLAAGVADAVAILVPHHLHEALATQALRGGLHVLLEKPMA